MSGTGFQDQHGFCNQDPLTMFGRSCPTVHWSNRSHCSSATWSDMIKSFCKFLSRAILTAMALILGTWLSFAASPNSPTPGRFVDVTEKLGIRFRQQASLTSKKYLLEAM